MKFFRYTTSGKLTNPVNDMAEAQSYLTDDDMTEYVGSDFEEFIVDIRWVLTSDRTWTVQVKSLKELSAEESQALSEWICGQNSDGLGEGFEQQGFAESFDRDNFGDMIEESFTMASFDWRENDCKLTPVQ